MSIFLLMDFAFYTLKIKQFNIQVLDSNKRAVRFNKSLGYTKNIELGEFWYSLTEENYSKKKEKLQAAVSISLSNN